MTEEKREEMRLRNEAICRSYQDGRNLAEIGKEFGLKRARIQQILQAAGVWRPLVREPRDEFVGVTVTRETKAALAAKAKERGVSVSRLASQTFEDLVKEEG